MENAAEVPGQVVSFSNEVYNAVVQHSPDVLGAILLLVVGWLLARLVRAATRKALETLNRFLEHVLSGRPRAVVRFSTGATHLLAAILYWVTLFIFVVMALRTAGLEGVANWLEQIIVYLPSFITGAVIIFVGYILSSVVRDTVYTTARSAELAEAELLSRLAWALTLITALIIGLDQAGVDITFITIMLGVITGTLLAGFALAFGMGAQTLVSNLIAAHYLRDMIQPGQTVRVGDCEGRVLDVSATAIILDTPEGRTSIPARTYQEQAVSVLLEESSDA